MRKFNEKDAIKEIEKAEKREPWFCPLVNGECRVECFCYVPAYKMLIPDIYGEEPRYHIVLPRCCNTILNPDGKKEIL